MKYDEFVRRVATVAGVTRRSAEAVSIATVTVLVEHLTPDEGRDLLAQLPKTFKQRVPIAQKPVSRTPAELTARVAELSGATVDDVEACVRAVCTTLADAVNAGELRDVLDQLGDDYAALFGRAAAHGQRPGNDLEAQARAALERAVCIARGAIATTARVGGIGWRVVVRTLDSARALGRRRVQHASMIVTDRFEDLTDKLDDTAEDLAERTRENAAR